MNKGFKRTISLALSAVMTFTALPMIKDAENDSIPADAAYVTDGLKGDVNCDRIIGIADAVTLQRYIIGNGSLSSRYNADLLEDELIDVYDTIAMRNRLVSGDPYEYKGRFYGSAEENDYAKLDGIGSDLTVTEVYGGEKGGTANVKMHFCSEPNRDTSFDVFVNGVKQVSFVSNGGPDWFTMQETSFDLTLSAGTDNNIKIVNTSGGVSHINTLKVGKTYPVINKAVRFLDENSMLSAENEDLKKDCTDVLSRITGSAETADSLYNQVCSDGELTQRKFLMALQMAMGYSDISAADSMRAAELRGIVGNIQSGSFGDVALDKNTLSEYVYNALSSKCSDGVTLGDKLGITISVQEYGVSLAPQNGESSASGNNATVVSPDGNIATVVTNDSYGQFTMIADVRADQLNGFAMGFRLNNPSDKVNDSGVWIKFVDQDVYLMSGGRTAYCETPMALFNVTDGVTIKAVDSGNTINLSSVIGEAEVPFFEIRFVDNYAVGYVRGHLIHGVPANNVPGSGRIALGSASGTVTYSNIRITAADSVQSFVTEFPESGDGKHFEAAESFENNMFDYNLLFGTGGGMSVSDGKLNFRSVGRENILSTTMRVENSVLQADVMPGSGEVQFQTGAGSSIAAGYYYCGMRFIVRQNDVAVYHDTGNMDEESPIINDIYRPHNMDVSQGYTARLSYVDGVISFSMKGLGEADFREIVRCVIKQGTNSEYISILDSGFVNEEAHFDKLMRQFGYLRIVSEQNAAIDNLYISGEAYLPYEQMEITAAPTPDPDKVLEADNLESLVGIGYLPYFTRYKYGDRPSVETLLPKVIEASKLPEDQREQAFNSLYWGYAWWAEPAQGMYCSRDKWATKNNLEMIANAGIDFIFIDHTNFNGGSTPDDIMNNIQLILDCALELEAEGKAYPKMCFWNSVRNEPYGFDHGGYEDTPREIWQVFISDPKYKNLWVYYHGKPLMMYTFGQPMSYLGMNDVAEIREMWTNNNVKNTWAFHNDPPAMDGRGGLDAEGNLEELYVLPYGKTTYNGSVNDLENTVSNGTGGREGGLMYKRYWEKVFAVRPKFVMIWAYNHWDVNFKRPENGSVYWGDNFNLEYSGGIEPIKNNFVYKGVSYPGDSYYNWTKEYISAYKANQAMPQDLYVKVD